MKPEIIRAEEARELSTKASDPNSLCQADKKVLCEGMAAIYVAAKKGLRHAFLGASTPHAIVSALQQLGYSCSIQRTQIGPDSGNKRSALEVTW